MYCVYLELPLSFLIINTLLSLLVKVYATLFFNWIPYLNTEQCFDSQQFLMSSHTPPSTLYLTSTNSCSSSSLSPSLSLQMQQQRNNNNNNKFCNSRCHVNTRPLTAFQLRPQASHPCTRTSHQRQGGEEGLKTNSSR